MSSGKWWKEEKMVRKPLSDSGTLAASTEKSTLLKHEFPRSREESTSLGNLSVKTTLSGACLANAARHPGLSHGAAVSNGLENFRLDGAVDI
jgi:hypothetical protein